MSEDVEITRTGNVGRIVLSRTRALNALNLAMVERIDRALDDWVDAGLRAITIESASERAFCAGGDIRQIRQNTLDGRPQESERFFATEYAVNRKLGDHPVPILALIDGICMGGGLGISVHGPFRVVTARASFAMPETKIGFFPDVGGTHFLPRLPGHLGAYLGLTGARIDAADALAIGMATHLVAPEDLARIPELIDAHDGPIDTLLKQLAVDITPSELLTHREQIDHCFGAPTVAEVFERLEHDGTPWARQTLESLRAVSPHSLALTMALISWGREKSLSDCLAMELAATRDVTKHPDFIEGVRATLVDKDHTPAWGEFAGEVDASAWV